MRDYEYAAVETPKEAERLAGQGWTPPSDPALAQIPTGWSSSGSTFILRRSLSDANAATLRRATEAMRRTGQEFLIAVADLLVYVNRYGPGAEGVDRIIISTAEQYLTDPGDVPETVA